MSQKRTGLQCKISSIFSQVPVSKKGDHRSTSKTSQSSHQEPDSSKSTPSKQTPAVLFKPHTVESHRKTASVHAKKTSTPELKSLHVLGRKAFRDRNTRFRPRAKPNPKIQRVALILLFIFSCLFVVVLIRNFKAHRPTSLDPIKQPISQALVEPSIEIKWPIPPKYLSNLRDPMELPKAIERPDLIVRGIVNIEDHLFAVVGGKVVGQGETVNDVKFIKIDPNNVQFELDGKKWIKAKTSDLVVKGIVLGEGRPKALIGIRTVEEGNEIFGATIVRISWGSVEFEMEGKKWTQKVEGDTKRTNDLKSNQ